MLRNIWIPATFLLALPLWGQNSIGLSCPSLAAAGGSVSCTLTLSLAASVSIDSLTFGLAVTPNNTAPALTQGQLAFQDLIGGGAITTGGSNNQISVLWFSLKPALSGSLAPGSVIFTLPASALAGQSYQVAIAGASAALGSTLVNLSIGPAATITIVLPTLTGVTANSGEQGQSLASVAIAGQLTNFVQGATAASFGAGIVVNSLTVNSPTSATANITIAGDAALGARDVTLITGSEVATLAGAFTVTAGPSLNIAKSHIGKFVQGQKSVAYSITVSNDASAGSTFNTVTVTENPPADLTLVSMSGTGWTCPGTAANNCTRSDALAAGGSYPPITVTANVSANAPPTVTNQAGVATSGVTVSVNDQTIVTSPCDVNQDGNTNIADVQKMINEALGAAAATNDLSADGIVNVVDIQKVINASVGLGCVI